MGPAFTATGQLCMWPLYVCMQKAPLRITLGLTSTPTVMPDASRLLDSLNPRRAALLARITQPSVGSASALSRHACGHFGRAVMQSAASPLAISVEALGTVMSCTSRVQRAGAAVSRCQAQHLSRNTHSVPGWGKPTTAL